MVNELERAPRKKEEAGRDQGMDGCYIKMPWVTVFSKHLDVKANCKQNFQGSKERVEGDLNEMIFLHKTAVFAENVVGLLRVVQSLSVQ